MRTQDLIARLARDPRPVERDAVERRLGRALLAGLAGGAVLLVTVFGIGSGMPGQILSASFWLRLAFPLLVIGAALELVERLVRPGAGVGLAWLVTLLPVLAMLLGAALFLWATPAALRLHLVAGGSIRVDTIAHTLLLSLPALVSMMRAMRGLAPTRLALAGAGAGLLAGAQGVLVYTLYCPDMPVPDWGLLHALAILLATAIGAALGPSCLRW